MNTKATTHPQTETQAYTIDTWCSICENKPDNPPWPQHKYLKPWWCSFSSFVSIPKHGSSLFPFLYFLKSKADWDRFLWMCYSGELLTTLTMAGKPSSVIWCQRIQATVSQTPQRKFTLDLWQGDLISKNSYNRVYIINSSCVLFSQLSSESRLHPECNTAHFMCAITVFKWTAAHSTEARSGDTAASHGHKHTFIALSCTVSQGFGISVESGRGSVNRVETENVHLLNAIKKPLCSMTHYVSHKLTYSEDPAFCRHT